MTFHSYWLGSTSLNAAEAEAKAREINQEIDAKVKWKIGAKKLAPIDRQRGGNAGVHGAAVGSDRYVAKLTGTSPETVRKERKRVDAIGRETMRRAAHTSLDKPAELDALAKLPEREREAVVAMAEVEAAKPAPERQKVSAVELASALETERKPKERPISAENSAETQEPKDHPTYGPNGPQLPKQARTLKGNGGPFGPPSMQAQRRAGVSTGPDVGSDRYVAKLTATVRTKKHRFQSDRAGRSVMEGDVPDGAAMAVCGAGNRPLRDPMGCAAHDAQNWLARVYKTRNCGQL